jgi:transposase-like protein
MPKETDLARFSKPQTLRTYTRQFQAELVVACQQPGASISAIALQHGMNANVLHRWLKEHARDGRHRLGGPYPLDYESIDRSARLYRQCLAVTS